MIRRVIISILRGYQYVISPLLGNRCRFYPSCSEYMIEAVRRFGVFKGMYLGFKRLARCQPMSEGGVDPVPDEYPSAKTQKSAVKQHPKD